MLLRRTISTSRALKPSVCHRRCTNTHSVLKKQTCFARFSSSTPNKDGIFHPESIDVVVDTSALERPVYDMPADLSKKSPETDLSKFIASSIRMRGPMSFPSFYRMCLTHPLYGYYMRRDVFGRQGDFVTSPEISQMFGELIGVWVIQLWKDLGKPSKFNIVELGPGRGTLMSDIMKVAGKMREFLRAVHIHFVEVSPVLRKLQAKSLGVEYPEEQQHEADQEAPAQPAEKRPRIILSEADAAEDLMTKGHASLNAMSGAEVSELKDAHVRNTEGIDISWHSSFDDVPDAPMAVIAQEFFDALPVYQFEWGGSGWRERMVDLDTTSENPSWFRFVTSPKASLASSTLIRSLAGSEPPALGETMEVSPDSFDIAHKIGSKINKNRGGALIIDYGENRPSQNSIRGIKDHKFVDIFLEPGNVDLSVNVDFAGLARSAVSVSSADKALTNNNVRILGPVTQGNFLEEMGIDVRLAKLLREAKTESEARSLISSYERLVTPTEMGSTYKVLAIVNTPDKPDWSHGFDPSLPPLK